MTFVWCVDDNALSQASHSTENTLIIVTNLWLHYCTMVFEYRSAIKYDHKHLQIYPCLVFFFNLAFKREPDVCKFVKFCFYNHVFTFSCPFNMFNLYLSYLFKLSFDFKSPTTRVAQQLLKPFLNLVLNVLNFLCF